MGEYRHYLAFRKMSEVYSSAYQAGDGAAIEQMIDFYGGRRDLRRLAAARSRLRIADHAGQPAGLVQRLWVRSRRPACSRKISIPTLVFWGETSHPAAGRANQLLGQCIPNAAVATIAGAAHFMIATHAGEVAGMIAQHVACAEDQRLQLADYRPS